MIRMALHKLRQTDAAGPLLLRAAVVGLNFCVMVWLSFQLGLSAFGALIYLWGAALVTSTIVSCGGPLVLLRALCDGSGLRATQIVGLTVVVPSLLCGIGWFASASIMPDDRWPPPFCGRIQCKCGGLFGQYHAGNGKRANLNGVARRRAVHSAGVRRFAAAPR